MREPGLAPRLSELRTGPTGIIDLTPRPSQTGDMIDTWNTPQNLAFRKATQDCLLAGETNRELKDILAAATEPLAV